MRELTRAEDDVAAALCAIRHWAGVSFHKLAGTCNNCRAAVVALVDGTAQDAKHYADYEVGSGGPICACNDPDCTISGGHPAKAQGGSASEAREAVIQAACGDEAELAREVARYAGYADTERERRLVAEAEGKRLREALTQIVKRDDWTSGECRHHARRCLDALQEKAT